MVQGDHYVTKTVNLNLKELQSKYQFHMRTAVKPSVMQLISELFCSIPDLIVDRLYAA